MTNLFHFFPVPRNQHFSASCGSACTVAAQPTVLLFFIPSLKTSRFVRSHTVLSTTSPLHTQILLIPNDNELVPRYMLVCLHIYTSIHPYQYNASSHLLLKLSTTVNHFTFSLLYQAHTILDMTFLYVHVCIYHTTKTRLLHLSRRLHGPEDTLLYSICTTTYCRSIQTRNTTQLSVAPTDDRSP